MDVMKARPITACLSAIDCYSESRMGQFNVSIAPAGKAHLQRGRSGRVTLVALILLLAPSFGRSRSVPPPQTNAATLREAGNAKNVILGAAADPSHLNEPEYATTLAQQFRQLEPENQMKFQ